jgi:hypothetical protein
MGLIENESFEQSVVFINLADGKFRQRSMNEGEGKSRVLGNGKTVWEKEYTSIEGYLREIVCNTEGYENAEQIVLTFLDKDVKIIFKVNTDSGIFRSFMKRLPNLEPSKMVKLSSFKSEYLGKEYTNIAVRQSEQAVQDAFKDVALPEPKEVTFKGKQYKDFEEQKEFLKLEIDKYNEKVNGFEPTFEVVHPAASNIPVPTQKDEPLPVIGDDDLPF